MKKLLLTVCIMHVIFQGISDWSNTNKQNFCQFLLKPINWISQDMESLNQFLPLAYRCHRFQSCVSWQVIPIAFCTWDIFLSNAEQKNLFFTQCHNFLIDLKWTVIWCFFRGALLLLFDAKPIECCWILLVNSDPSKNCCINWFQRFKSGE